MKIHFSKPKRIALMFFLIVTAVIPLCAAQNVVVWDTTARAKAVNIRDRAKWKNVPSDLLTLEKDPLKASSDPGYYGRDYKFAGDVVVENSFLVAALSSESGRFSLFAKPHKMIMESEPQKGGAARSFELIRNAGDEVVLKMTYAGGESTTFTFGKNEIIEIKPSDGSLAFASPIEHAIVPGFVGDDIIYSGGGGSSDALAIPAENMLVGLLKGEDCMLVMTWPGAAQNPPVFLSPEGGVKISGLAKGGLFLAALPAPGIWHREKLDSGFLETDKKIDWKQPFPAKWQTQLSEGSVKTTFAFRAAKGTVWRGVPGSYNYPVWFEGDNAFFSLSKKVPPRGEAIIYFLEGHNTPLSVLTPVDVLKATLGRVAAEPILDVAGRKLRTHHGPCGSNVHRACTCGYTEAIQAVFEKREETAKKEFIDQSVRDMIYFVQCHLERIDEYRAFAKSFTEYLQSAAKTHPELKDYLEGLEQTAQQIPQEYENQKENMKSLAFAVELEKQTMALTGKSDPENLKQYMELSKTWRAMGGAQDYVVAQCHTLARKLFQDASYTLSANAKPAETEIALAIRARIKEILRNPDGYEIWPNY